MKVKLREEKGGRRERRLEEEGSEGVRKGAREGE